MKPRQAEFEAWAEANGFRVRLRDDKTSPDLYFHYETEQRWKCWQAATAACAAAQPVPRMGGIDELKRYSLIYEWGNTYMDEWKEGDFVYFDEVKKLLQQEGA